MNCLENVTSKLVEINSSLTITYQALTPTASNTIGAVGNVCYFGCGSNYGGKMWKFNSSKTVSTATNYPDSTVWRQGSVDNYNGYAIFGGGAEAPYSVDSDVNTSACVYNSSGTMTNIYDSSQPWLSSYYGCTNIIGFNNKLIVADQDYNVYEVDLV